MKLPSGPGAPASDAADVLTQATKTCHGIRTFTAEIAVSGSVGASRTRGRLAAGLAAPASARLEAVAPFGEPLFIFAATGNDATLLLPRDRRVLEHGPPDELLEAIAGVPLGAADLRATFTGCTTGAADPGTARQLGDLWRVAAVGPGHDAYLHRDSASAPWRLVASVRHAPVLNAAGALMTSRTTCRAVRRQASRGAVGPDLQLCCRSSRSTCRSAPTCFACRFQRRPIRSLSRS
jgi:hypothetical protein